MTTPPDMNEVRAQVEAARKTLTPEAVLEHEKKLLLGVFDAWPQVVEGLCNALNELFKEQVVIAQAIDSAPLKVKAVRPETLRAAIEEKGLEAVHEVLQRVTTNDTEILRRARALRAERDRLLAAVQGGSTSGPAK